MQSGSGDSSASIMQLLSELKSSEVSLINKYKTQNEIRRRARQSPEVLALVKSSVKDQPEFIFKKLILDCELQAENATYLFDFIFNSDETLLTKYAVSKATWAFKVESISFMPKTFIDVLLPAVSFTIRESILWQLSKNLKDQIKCEEYYKAVESRFGSDTSNILLPACSSEFVDSLIKSKEKLRLTQRQLSILMKRHPQTSIRYLKKKGVPTYPQLMTRVAKIDPEAFLDIYEADSSLTYRCEIRLCSSITKILMDKFLDRIVSKASIYSKLLHKPTIFRYGGSQIYTKFLISDFPDSVEAFEDFEYGIVGLYRDWIDILPTKVNKGELFHQSFQLRYETSLEKCPNCISQSLLKIFSPEEREKYADLKLASLTPEYHSNNLSTMQGSWIACKPTEKSLPQLKALIAQESDHHNRQQLLSYLVQTCSINKDGEALNQVCKYYGERHRNERHETHSRFISDIAREFEPKDLHLDQTGLQYLVGVLKLYMIGLEKDSHVQISDELLEAIYFSQLDNSQSTSWILPIIFKKKLEAIKTWMPAWNFVKEKHFKDNYLCLMERMVESIDSLPLRCPEDYCRFIIAILRWCQDWNSQKGNKKFLSIKHFPVIEEKLPEILESTGEIVTTEVLQALVSALLGDQELWKDSTNVFFKKCLELIPEENVILHFLKHDSNLLKQNWQPIAKYIFSTFTKRVYGRKTNILRIVSKLNINSYTWYLEQLRREFESRVVDLDVESTEKVHSVGIASLSLSSDDFMTWASKYYPSPEESSVSVHDQPDSYLGLVALRKGICSYLKNIQHVSRGIPALLHFCAGDNLKYAIGSLYSIILRSGFSNAKSFLTQLTQRPAVSVKKHGIRLMTKISSKTDVRDFLTSMWAIDEHPTTRHVILKELLSRIHYDEGAWDILKSGILDLSVTKDKDSFAELINCDNIPGHLIQEYLNLVWLKYNEEKLQRAFHTSFVMFGVQPNLKRLSTEWTLKFLEDNLFQGSSESAAFQSGVSEVMIKCLLRSAPGNQVVLLNIVDSSVKKHTSTGEKIIYLFKVFGRFIEDLCKKSLHGKSSKKRKKEDLLQLFESTQKMSIFTQQNPITFPMKLYLKFTAVMHSVQEDGGLSSKGRLLGLVLDEYIELFGTGISPFFAKQFVSFIQNVWTPDRYESDDSTPTQVDHMELLTGFLESSHTNPDEKRIILLQLLPVASPKGDGSKEKYDHLLNQIKNSKSFLVQLHYGEWALNGMDVMENGH